MPKRKVLVTGISGRIGTIVRQYLGDKYELSGLDRVAVKDVPCTVADISDLDAIRPAFKGQDTVVHLAADPNHLGSWESNLKNNFIGTYNVLEASREADVRRVIFASSNHVVGFYPMKQDPYKAIYEGRLGEVRRPFPLLTPEMYRPDGYYGVAKAFGELLGSYYHDQYGISFIALRIGWVVNPDDPKFHPSCLSLWLSHRDAAQLIERSIEAPASVGFTVVYGMSNNDLLIWDLEPTKRILGYQPQDNAGEKWTPRADRKGLV